MKLFLKKFETEKTNLNKKDLKAEKGTRNWKEIETG